MTMPVGFQSASLLVNPSYAVLEIGGTAQSEAIALAMEVAVSYGYSGTMQVYADPTTRGVVWRLSITDSQGNDQFAYQGYWMVLSGTTLTFYSPTEFAAKFTTDVALDWAATKVPPAATSTIGLAANITFPGPDSADGPFTYAVSGTGTFGTPAVDPDTGNVTIPVSGLTLGSQYSWTVTASTQYSGVSAVSLATNVVTAFEVEGS